MLFYYLLVTCLFIIIFLYIAPVQTTLFFVAIFAGIMVNYVMHHIFLDTNVSIKDKILISGAVSGVVGFACGFYISHKLDKYRKI